MVMVLKATPRAVLRGIRDDSRRQLPTETRSLPQHLPLFFLLTQKSEEIEIVGGNAARTIYGDETFESNSPFYTHQTVAAETAFKRYNQAMIVPIKMDGATKATLRLSVELVATTVNDKPVTRVIWHAEPIDEAGREPFSKAQINPAYRAGQTESKITGDKLGALVDENGDKFYTPSAKFPIIDLAVEARGEYGNNFALSIETPTEQSHNPPDTRLFNVLKQYVYRLTLYRKSSPSISPAVIYNSYSDTSSDFVLKKDFVHPNTNLNMSLGEVITTFYQDTDNPEKPPVYGPFPNVAIYQENIEAVASMLAGDYEVTAVSDTNVQKKFTIKGVFDTPEEAKEGVYSINFFTGHDLGGKYYPTMDLSSSRKFGGVRFGRDAIIYAQGGSDGFPTNLGAIDKLKILQLFDEKVRSWCEQFDEVNPLYDSAKYPFSALWDSGFSMGTKKALMKPVGMHKRIMTTVGTHAVADYADPVNLTGFMYRPALSGAEEISVAMMLKAYGLLVPESEEFGTPTVRIGIVGRSGHMHDTRYRGRLPLTIELLDKVANYCGAGDAVWRNGQAFDVHPNNRVELFKQDTINVTYQSVSVYNKSWDAALMWVQNADTTACFFPAFRSIYPDDTSVLTSYINMMACCYIERICEEVWRKLVGNGKYTDDQFIEASDELISEALNGKFDGRYKIVPRTFYTVTDKILGFRWSTEINFYASNMKTVGTFTIIAKRLSDYQPSNSNSN